MSDGRSSARILILGGTGDGRRLAAALTASGLSVVTSLAGRLTVPILPAGEVRIGGFGGRELLAAWLREQAVQAVVDATHPFAARITQAAIGACEDASIPYLRLERPAWTEQPGDRWHRVADLPAAAQVACALGRRVLLTIGRQEAAAFADFEDTWFLVRCIEAPTGPLPPHHELLLRRGPFSVDEELALFEAQHIDVLVTKDSGGAETEAKLTAARRLGLPVVMVSRPATPDVPRVATVDAACAWVRQVADPRVSPARGASHQGGGFG